MVVLSLLTALSLSRSASADVLTGSFSGSANVDYFQYVNAQLVKVIQARDIPAQLFFDIATETLLVPPSFGSPSVFLGISNSVYTAFAQSEPVNHDTVTIFDGIPGQSADFASARTTFIVDRYGATRTATFQLTDPTGEYIAPNGNGDPSQVMASADIPFYFSDVNGTGYQGEVSFISASLPEPSSLVEVACGALILLVYARVRAVRRRVAGIR
jgi:hypothetical protein